MDDKKTNSIHMEEQSAFEGHVMAVSKATANHTEAQHLQTKKQAIVENWKGIAWCKCNDIFSIHLLLLS